MIATGRIFCEMPPFARWIEGIGAFPVREFRPNMNHRNPFLAGQPIAKGEDMILGIKIVLFGLWAVDLGAHIILVRPAANRLVNLINPFDATPFKAHLTHSLNGFKLSFSTKVGKDFFPGKITKNGLGGGLGIHPTVGVAGPTLVVG